MGNKTRLPGIDALRFLGLSLIILAHVDPPAVLFQLRNFDVPLMVFVSGLSLSLAKKSDEAYFSYILKRFKRLVLPTWFFLMIYFIGLYFFNVSELQYQLDLNIMLLSFTLVFGIGYVWVIRVFMCVAILAPILVGFFSSRGNKLSILLIIFGLLVNETLAEFLQGYIGSSVSTAIYIVFFEIPPYAVIFCIGYICLRLKRNELVFLGGVSLTCFLILVVYYKYKLGFIPDTQGSKYPPLLYYTSYSIFMLLCCFAIREKLASILSCNKYFETVFSFVANNSLWIYLWHIIFITYFNIAHHEYHFMEKYLCAYLGGVLLTYVQICIVTFIIKKMKNTIAAKNIKIIFTG